MPMSSSPAPSLPVGALVREALGLLALLQPDEVVLIAITVLPILSTICAACCSGASGRILCVLCCIGAIAYVSVESGWTGYSTWAGGAVDDALGHLSQLHYDEVVLIAIAVLPILSTVFACCIGAAGATGRVGCAVCCIGAITYFSLESGWWSGFSSWGGGGAAQDAIGRILTAAARLHADEVVLLAAALSPMVCAVDLLLERVVAPCCVPRPVPPVGAHHEGWPWWIWRVGRLCLAVSCPCILLAVAVMESELAAHSTAPSSPRPSSLAPPLPPWFPPLDLHTCQVPPVACPLVSHDCLAALDTTSAGGSTAAVDAFARQILSLVSAPQMLGSFVAALGLFSLAHLGGIPVPGTLSGSLFWWWLVLLQLLQYLVVSNPPPDRAGSGPGHGSGGHGVMRS